MPSSDLKSKHWNFWIFFIVENTFTRGYNTKNFIALFIFIVFQTVLKSKYWFKNFSVSAFLDFFCSHLHFFLWRQDFSDNTLKCQPMSLGIQDPENLRYSNFSHSKTFFTPNAKPNILWAKTVKFCLFSLIFKLQKSCARLDNMYFMYMQVVKVNFSSC